jgi:hypothetical protein
MTNYSKNNDNQNLSVSESRTYSISRLGDKMYRGVTI